MNRVRIIVLAVALTAAALAAYLASGILRGNAPQHTVAEPPPQPAMVEVLTAARDLAPGERLVLGTLEWQPWPRDSASNLLTRETKPDALEEMATARARQPIFAGEPVIERKVVDADNGSFMSAILPQGMRAISVAISEHSAVSGFILPDDRVDVIVTRNYFADGSQIAMAMTETVLRNVRVLAINQTFRPEGEDKVTVPEGKTAVLELDPLQAEIVAKAEALGKLSLALRPLAEGGEAGLRNARLELATPYKNNTAKLIGGGPVVIRYGVAVTPGRP
jgi:pilus assembly protein CpaB